MKPVKITNKIVKKFNVEINPQKDKAIFQKMLELQKNCSEMKKQLSPMDILGFLLRSRMVQATTVIVLFIFIGFYVVGSRSDTSENTVKVSIPSVPKSELTTLAALNLAYRKGGMEMIEDKYDKAFLSNGPRSIVMSIRDYSKEIGN